MKKSSSTKAPPLTQAQQIKDLTRKLAKMRSALKPFVAYSAVVHRRGQQNAETYVMGDDGRGNEFALTKTDFTKAVKAVEASYRGAKK